MREDFNNYPQMNRGLEGVAGNFITADLLKNDLVSRIFGIIVLFLTLIVL